MASQNLSHIEQLHSNDVDLEALEIYLGNEDGIDHLMATTFVKNLRLVSQKAKSEKRPVLIHMNSNGGDWHQGMAIYHSIKSCPVPTIILSYTEASSMSSIILQAADKRVLMPHSVVMLHWGQDMIAGERKTVESTWEFYTKKYDDKQIMLDIYTDRILMAQPKKKRGIIKRSLEREINKHADKYYTAEEAVETGLADCIFDYNWTGLKKIS